MDIMLEAAPVCNWMFEGYDKNEQCLVMSRLSEDCTGLERIKISNTDNGVVLIRNDEVDWFKSWHNFWSEFLEFE